MSGGSPAAIEDRSLAVLDVAELGIAVSVTWMPGCVLLNWVVIWLSNCKVAPDHMVHHVRFTTEALATVAEPIPTALTTAAVAIAVVTLARRRCFNHFVR
jgi:hypothetical protein